MGESFHLVTACVVGYMLVNACRFPAISFDANNHAHLVAALYRQCPHSWQHCIAPRLACSILVNGVAKAGNASGQINWSVPDNSVESCLHSCQHCIANAHVCGNIISHLRWPSESVDIGSG